MPVILLIVLIIELYLRNELNAIPQCFINIMSETDRMLLLDGMVSFVTLPLYLVACVKGGGVSALTFIV